MTSVRHTDIFFKLINEKKDFKKIMNITLKQLQAFVSVARLRSFAAAADSLNLSQPALSLTIKKLEEGLGGQLLLRTTRSISLTPEGEVLYQKAARMLDQWQSQQQEMLDLFALNKGKVELAVMPSFAAALLPQGVARFRQQYPGIKITVHDVVAEKVVDMVRHGEVELGITFDPVVGDDLIFDTLFEEHFVAVLAQDHALAKEESLSWRKLVCEDFVMLQSPSALTQLIQTELEKTGLSFSILCEAHQLATVGQLVAHNVGVSVMPSLCVPQLQPFGVVAKPMDKPKISRKVGLVRRKRFPLSQAAASLRSVLLSTLRT